MATDCFCVLTPSHHIPAQPPPPASPHGTWDVVDGEWIVRFTAYAPAGSHISALTAALGVPSSQTAGGGATWAWVDRPNPAAAFPTDFGVIRLGAASKLNKVRLASERCVVGRRAWRPRRAPSTFVHPSIQLFSPAHTQK